MEILRRRQSKGTLRTVWREDDQIVKEFRIVSWPPDFRRPWRREHKALDRLNRQGVFAPTTYGFRSLRPGVVQYRRQYIAGELLQKDCENRSKDLPAHFAAIHAVGVTNGDAALDNILVTEEKQFVLIDYGRARIALIKGPLFYLNVGKELARIRRSIFGNDPSQWESFLEAYARIAEYPSWAWLFIHRALFYWLRRWRVGRSIGKRRPTSVRSDKR
jgi:tRNA A-37 threonylcarbamoyl transferase component Bud32